MNIGIFTDTYYPQINGVATSVRTLEKELNKLGHKVYIFTTTDPDCKVVLPRVFRLPSMPFVFFPSRRVTFMYPPKLILKIKRFNLDIVHTQTEFPLGFFGKAVAEYYKIPIVHTYHTMYEDYVHYVANGHLVTPKMTQGFSRFFCNRADMVITPAEKSCHSLLQYGVKKPVKVIPTGLDFSKFEKKNCDPEEVKKIKAELGIGENDPVILSLGRVSLEKGVHLLVAKMPELLSRIPNAKFVIVGDGPMLGEIEENVKKLNIEKSVIFAGSKPWEIINNYYQIGDIFVSASESETQGLTYIEAMAGKIPVVVKRDDSVKGIVKHGETGYFFDTPNDFPDIAFEALNNMEKTKEIAENAYRGIQNLSSEQFAKNMEYLYQEVINLQKPIRVLLPIAVTKNLLSKIKKS